MENTYHEKLCMDLKNFWYQDKFILSFIFYEFFLKYFGTLFQKTATNPTVNDLPHTGHWPKHVPWIISCSLQSTN